MASLTPTPDLVPLLARGRHRNPRRGACFMELASYLAGERWSDAPRCTDPTLALLARMVNDLTSDDERPRLGPLVPGVVGITGMPPSFAGDLALLVTSHVIRDVAMTHQRALAVGAMRLMQIPGKTAHPAVRARVQHALRDVPDAKRWAAEFLGRIPAPERYSPAHGVLEIATHAIATACIPDPDGRMRAILTDAIDLARDIAGAGEPPVLEPRSWRRRVRAARLATAR